MSCTELKDQKKWLKDNLVKGFIPASSSPAEILILLVKKPDESLRLCVVYQWLNDGTLKN